MIRDHAGPLVADEVTLLSKQLELSQQGRTYPNCQRQRLDSPEVVGLALGSVSGGVQRCGGQLKRSVIGNVQLPVRAEPRCQAIVKITIRYGEQVLDLLSAAAMFFQPPALKPTL